MSTFNHYLKNSQSWVFGVMTWTGESVLTTEIDGYIVSEDGAFVNFVGETIWQ